MMNSLKLLLNLSRMFLSLSKRSQEKKTSEARVPSDILLSYPEDLNTKLLTKLPSEKQDKTQIQLSLISKFSTSTHTNTTQNKAVEEEIDSQEADLREEVDLKEKEVDLREEA